MRQDMEQPCFHKITFKNTLMRKIRKKKKMMVTMVSHLGLIRDPQLPNQSKSTTRAGLHGK